MTMPLHVHEAGAEIAQHETFEMMKQLEADGVSFEAALAGMGAALTAVVRSQWGEAAAGPWWRSMAEIAEAA